MKKKIAVIFNGGTISMKVDEKIKAAVPSLTGEEIMKMVTGIESHVNIETHNFSSFLSPHVTPQIMLKLSKFITSLSERNDIDGIVVTHGTDTLEETSYMVNLTTNTQKPIVFTGAMRSGSELGYDGPSNLADAIFTAANDESKGRGVLICFNGELNSASEVTKANSMALNAFKTPNFGPIGIVDNDNAIFYRRSVKEEYIPVNSIEKKVAIIKCAAGMDSEFLKYCVDSGYDGIILEALGRGNVPPEMVEGIKECLDKKIVVILTSRCFEGRVFASYGYLGGGKQLRDLGVIFGDNLPSQKARIKLLALLSFSNDLMYIKHSFEQEKYLKL